MGHSDCMGEQTGARDCMVECDGLDTTQLIRRALTSSGRQALRRLRLRAAIPGNLSDVHLGSHLTEPVQSPHLTENTCHEKSDFYIIIMIIVYLL